MHNKDPKVITSAQLRYIFRRVLKRIKEKPKGYFKFVKLRGSCGICYYDDCIKIDPRKQLIPTIIHEVLHDLYPKNWEGWTQRLESKISNIISPFDVYKLITVFFSKLDIKIKRKPRYKKKKSKKNKNR